MLPQSDWEVCTRVRGREGARARTYGPRRKISSGVFKVVLAGDDEVDGLWPFALFVGLDLEANALAFHQRLQPRAFNSGDVDEDVAAAIVGLDEAVATLAVEKFDRAGHCHCITPSRAHAAAVRRDG